MSQAISIMMPRSKRYEHGENRPMLEFQGQDENEEDQVEEGRETLSGRREITAVPVPRAQVEEQVFREVVDTKGRIHLVYNRAQ